MPCHALLLAYNHCHAQLITYNHCLIACRKKHMHKTLRRLYIHLQFRLAALLVYLTLRRDCSLHCSSGHCLALYTRYFDSHALSRRSVPAHLSPASPLDLLSLSCLTPLLTCFLSCVYAPSERMQECNVRILHAASDVRSAN